MISTKTIRSTMAPALPIRMAGFWCFFCEVPAGERDDQRVVAGQDDVDHDDLKQAAPESGR